MVAKTFLTPFALNGNKTPVPDDQQPSGAVSYDQGFGPDYERQLGVDPLAKDISRENFNAVINDITNALQEIQAGEGSPAWSSQFATAIGGYAKGAIVPRSDGNGYWVCTVAGTTTDPSTTTTGWAPLSVAGMFTQALSNVNVTPTLNNASFPVITLTGTLTGNVQLILPNWVYRWQIINNCTGNFTVTAKLAASSGVVLPNGHTSNIVGNGSDILQAKTGVVTPPQFDVSKLLVNSEFVQRALGNSSDFEELTGATRTITAADGGKTFIVTTATAITFPDSTTLPAGWQVTVLGSGSASCTLTGSSFITSRGAVITGQTISGFSIQINARKSTNQYRVSHMGDGPTLQASSGYLTLPSGWIIQTGGIIIPGGAGSQSFTLPIAFPTNMISYSLVTSVAGTWISGQGANATSITAVARTVSAGNIIVPAASVSVNAIFIGY